MRLLIWLCALFGLWSCSDATEPPVSLAPNESIFIRIIKSDLPNQPKGRLEMFVAAPDAPYRLLKSWETCTWSGDLGPKLKEGDGQSPEGFYFVRPSQLNPNSSYHLSFNLGFPNAYDRAHGRTGSFLMVHGDCVSIGCYAMTDAGIEEIYALVEQAFANGQDFVRVHAFPFPMTDKNLQAVAGDPNVAFWENLRDGWDWFERERRPPNVEVEDKLYVFEAG